MQQSDGALFVFLRQSNFRTQHVSCDLQDVFCLVIYWHGKDHVLGRILFRVRHDLILRLGFTHLPFSRQDHAAREMPEHGHDLHFRFRPGHLEDFVPLVKAHIHRDRDGHEAFQRRHVLDMGRHVRGQQVGIFVRFRVVAIHG